MSQASINNSRCQKGTPMYAYTITLKHVDPSSRYDPRNITMRGVVGKDAKEAGKRARALMHEPGQWIVTRCIEEQA